MNKVPANDMKFGKMDFSMYRGQKVHLKYLNIKRGIGYENPYEKGDYIIPRYDFSSLWEAIWEIRHYQNYSQKKRAPKFYAVIEIEEDRFFLVSEFIKSGTFLKFFNYQTPDAILNEYKARILGALKACPKCAPK